MPILRLEKRRTKDLEERRASRKSYRSGKNGSGKACSRQQKGRSPEPAVATTSEGIPGGYLNNRGLAGTLLRCTVSDHDQREGGCGSSINPKGNCASRKLIARGTSPCLSHGRSQ
jgi:hypothetical protein